MAKGGGEKFENRFLMRYLRRERRILLGAKAGWGMPERQAYLEDILSYE